MNILTLEFKLYNMKKTVFKGTVNGIHFDDVKKYNEYLTKLIEAGEPVTAETSTQTVDCTEITNNKSVTYDENILLPYFGDDVEEYYLDALVTDDEAKNNAIYTQVLDSLSKSYEHIKKFLSDKKVSESDKEKYVDDVLDIINTMKQDAEYNGEALEKLNETRAEARTDYEAAVAAAKEDYDATVAGCDTEEKVLNGANLLIERFIDFYTDVFELASEYIDVKECCDKCCDGDCKCGKHAKTEVKTEVKEKTKQQVKDLNSLFNKIFGIGLDDLSKHLNA